MTHQAPDECFPLVSRPAQAVDLAAMPHHGGPHAAVAGGSQGGLCIRTKRVPVIWGGAQFG
eukprot:1159359-Pelagomonas_calceolata.AAC.6